MKNKRPAWLGFTSIFLSEQLQGLQKLQRDQIGIIVAFETKAFDQVVGSAGPGAHLLGVYYEAVEIQQSVGAFHY